MCRKKSTIVMAMVGLLMVAAQTLPAVACAATDEVAENSKPPLQIVNQSGLKVVVQINYADTMPNGISKQIMAAKNLYSQYTALGMKPGKDYEIVMVFRGAGAQFLLTNKAYSQDVKQPHAKGNPNAAILDQLNKGGVKMYECNVAMKLKGYTAADIMPYSRIVVSGIGAIVDFEKSGYVSITP